MPRTTRPAHRAAPESAIRSGSATRKFTARLPAWLLDALGAQASRNGVATNALFIEYLGRAVDPMNADLRDAAISERLRSIELRLTELDTLAWRQRVTLESIGVLAKTVLSYLREATTREERAQAHAQGERRFPVYTQRVAEWTEGREKGFAASLEELFEQASIGGAMTGAESSAAPPAPEAHS